MSISRSLLCLTLLVGVGASLPVIGLVAADNPSDPKLPTPVDREVGFVKDVQPILRKRCFGCHGPKKQEAGLRLDVRAEALAGGDEGISIVKGDSAKSPLIHRVSGVDPDFRMPPEGDPLSPAEVAVLRAWIDQGLDWPADADGGPIESQHWAYQSIIRRVPPLVKSEDRIRNPIDAYVLAKLAELKLQPSPEADRYTLIRRLYLDLLGLPPSLKEIDAFVRDESPQAYDKLVDALLKSPHFGERWGRHWLDLARYADSDGYEKDRPRPNAWRWRDWVIDAVNRDMPFDEFTIEQIAGDLLPNATAMQRLATAFHRQTLTNTEGGTDQEQFRVEACFDRAETTGTVWLGLTIGCARCHSHKYDQITQREYYRIFAFVNNGDDTNSTVPTSSAAVQKYEQDLATYQQKLQGAEDMLAAARGKLAPELAAWEADFAKRVAAAAESPVTYHTLEFAKLEATSKSKFERQDDGSYLVTGGTPDKDGYTLWAKVPAADITGIRIETVPDDRLPGKGAGRAPNSNFVLSDVRVYFAGRIELKDEDIVKLTSARSDFHQEKFPAAAALDSDKVKTGWAVSPKMGERHSIEFATQKPLSVTDGEPWLQIVLDQQYGGQHTIGRFRASVRTGSNPRDGVPQNILDLLAGDPDKRTPQQTTSLLDWFATQHTSTRNLVTQVGTLKKNAPKKPELTVRVVSQRTSNPRPTYVLRRGEFLEPIKEQTIVPAGLSVLPTMKARKPESPDRLDLAYWLVSDDNPLTPRVTVNHVWKHLFGEGLVRTVNDFGVRGEKPTHPKLLDWLAAGLRGPLGWSRKQLIRLIVTSATYRQASVHRPELAESDPNNRLLARQNRTRVEAEIVRDVSLSVSGLLSTKIGGPSVFPPLPPGVADFSYAGNFKWNTSKGEDRYRRGMYTFFKRTSPHPNLTTFDCPDANTTSVKRQTSNTPLQALIMLNNQVYLEAARSFAKNLSALAVESDDARLGLAFRQCVARPMSGTEAMQFTSLLNEARTWYTDHPEDAKKLCEEDSAETAAWVATCRVMLNLDEFITRN